MCASSDRTNVHYVVIPYNQVPADYAPAYPLIQMTICLNFF